MKIVKFVKDSEAAYGIFNNKIYGIAGSIFTDFTVLKDYVLVDEVTLLAPCTPSKAVCIGLNYNDHKKKTDLEEPTLFLKPPSSLNNPNGIIEYPAISNDVQYEAELAIVIKKQARNIVVENAYEYILGYTCANDVSARDLQKRDGQWTRGKSFDTFMPLGPCIETDIDPHNLDIKLYLNDKVCQSSNTCNLLFNIPELIAFITEVMTLYPGDVILTGTPAGVGPMQIGDRVVVEIEGIGRLENTIGNVRCR
ncbi:MAG: ureidoglycolate lyase [Pelosinus sp.]|nr:ureidoglycolate lyase [Pelosinus sp.]